MIAKLAKSHFAKPGLVDAHGLTPVALKKMN
jgi:hypothetical protein